MRDKEWMVSKGSYVYYVQQEKFEYSINTVKKYE